MLSSVVSLTGFAETWLDSWPSEMSKGRVEVTCFFSQDGRTASCAALEICVPDTLSQAKVIAGLMTVVVPVVPSLCDSVGVSTVSFLGPNCSVVVDSYVCFWVSAYAAPAAITATATIAKTRNRRLTHLMISYRSIAATPS